MSEKQEHSEGIIDNIILDGNKVTSIEDFKEGNDLILFSELGAGAKPVKQYFLNTDGLQYTQLVEKRCAICCSPHRDLLEHVYINEDKNVNAVVKFFETHYRARLNWPQVKRHLKQHCNMDDITIPGLKRYDKAEEEVARWKYREYELAYRITAKEIDEVGSLVVKTPDEQFKKTTLMDKLSSKLIQIKKARDEVDSYLPNCFEVLESLHDIMVCDDDRRIVRQKVKELQKLLDD